MQSERRYAPENSAGSDGGRDIGIVKALGVPVAPEPLDVARVQRPAKSSVVESQLDQFTFPMHPEIPHVN
ncbi:hypothetical protein RVF87_14595 [Gordonia hydrophobica]|uniref:Transposase n=1 Tax=Gordonia hydrophobica TaxID=40516 RepID=A0ABZ2TY72_9ACTN